MLTTKELNRKVAGIRRSSAAIRENIHVVLVNLAGHAYEHGDVSVAVNLLNATKGVDKVAIVKYLRDSCFTLVKSDGSVKLNKKARAEADFVDGDAVVTHLNTEVQPWYEEAVTTEKAASIVDYEKMLANAIKKIEKSDAENVKDYNADTLRELTGRLESALDAKRRERNLLNRTVSEIAEGRAIEDAQEAA